MKYIKNQYKILIKSLKEFDIKIIFIVLFDLLFYSLSLLSLFLFSKFIQNKTIEISKLPLDRLIELPQEQLKTILSELKGFLFIFILVTILLFIVIFLLACIFKSLIWLKITEKKLNKTFLKKFIITKLIWNLIWLIPIVLLFLLLKKSLIAPFLVIMALLIIHFTNILYIKFNNKLRSIKEVFKLGTKKIHLFILPYIVIILGFLIVIQLYWIYRFLPESLQGVISAIILLIYIAFSRIYLYNVVKEI